jgi:hypothetical protein
MTGVMVIPMIILIRSNAASRRVVQRPANKTLDVVLAVNAVSKFRFELS